MEVRTERDDHERDALGHGRLHQVTQAKVELDARERGAAGADVEHPPRRVDADHVKTVRRDRDRDPPGADTELDDRAGGATRLGQIERHVLGDRRAPRIVETGDRVVGARRWIHRHILVTPGDSPLRPGGLCIVWTWLCGCASSCLPGPGSPGTGADERLRADGFDVTLPGEELAVGTLHPTTQIRRMVEDAFLGLGYEIREDREVETVEYNFDKLAFAPTHPTRSPRSTLFLDESTLLRTEPSPPQRHQLEEHEPPVYMASR